MSRFQYYIPGVCLSFCVFACSISVAQAQPSSAGQVEVFAQGKQYRSIREYKRSQIKKVIAEALSLHDLREVSEEELCIMIKEIARERKKEEASPKGDQSIKSSEWPLQDEHSVEADAQDTDTSQMNKMLKSYLNEHGEAGPVTIDPGKVKSIIIDQK